MSKLEFVGHRQTFEGAKECFYFSEMEMAEHPEPCLIIPTEIVDGKKLRTNNFLWCDFKEMTLEERKNFPKGLVCWIGIYGINQMTDELRQKLIDQYGLRYLCSVFVT